MVRDKISTHLGSILLEHLQARDSFLLKERILKLEKIIIIGDADVERKAVHEEGRHSDQGDEEFMDGL